MKVKRLLFAALFSITALSCTLVVDKPVDVQAESSYVYGGGRINYTNCYWGITSDGVLEITGEGDPGINLKGKPTYETLPWSIYTAYIEKVVIADTVKPTSIAYWFYNCSNMVEAPTIPDSVKDCSYAFYKCTSLETAPEIPEGVENCSDMFSGCTNLSNTYKIPNTVTDCSYMFYGCESLIESPELSNSVTSCDGMFSECKSLETAPKLPNTLRSATRMFYNCYYITEVPKLPDSLIYCSYMFYNCEMIDGVVDIPDNATDCSYMFYDCGSLTGVVSLGNSVQNCDGMFYYCYQLKYVGYVPSTVTNFNKTFYSCSSLDYIVLDVKSMPTSKSGMFSYDCKANVYYTSDSNVDITNSLLTGYSSLKISELTEPIIVEQPKSTGVLVGDDVSFSTSVCCKDSTYKWFVAQDATSDGVELDNSNSHSYTVTSDLTDDYDGKYFYCVITDSNDVSVTSDRAKLTVESKVTAPTVSFSREPNDLGWYSEAVTLTLDSSLNDSSDGIIYQYYKDDDYYEYWVDCDKSFDWTTNRYDSPVKFRAYSKLNNKNISDITEVEIKYDSEYPEIYYNMDDYYNVPTSITIEAYAGSGIYGYALTTTKEEPTEWTTETKFNIEERDYYYLWAKNNAGLVSCYTIDSLLLYGLEDEVYSEGLSIKCDGNYHSGYVECDNSTVVYNIGDYGDYYYEDIDYNLTEVPKFKDVGIYTVNYKVNRKGYYSYEGNYVVEITQGDGVASISMNDIPYGSSINPVVNSVTNDEGYSIWYKVKGSDDSTYKRSDKWTPTEVGDYVARVFYSETSNFTSCSAEAEFSILDVIYPDNKPESSITVPYSVKKVKDISLENNPNWAWSSDSMEIDLNVGETVTAVAEYIGSDAGDYSTTTCRVSITRQACTHEEVSIIDTIEPTCISTGFSGNIFCNDCETVISEGHETDITDHTWDAGKITLKPTEDEDGIRLFTCTVDGCSATKEVKLSFGWCKHIDTGSISMNSVKPTCETDGYTGDVYCMACEELLSRGTDVPSLGHSWSEGTVTTEPTYKSEGVLTTYCLNDGCDKVNTSVIPALVCEHTNTEVRDVIKESCTENGHTGDVYCLDCDSVVVSGEFVTSLGHKWNEGVVTKQPTYSADGVMTYNCMRDGCSSSYTSSIDKLTCDCNKAEVRNHKKPTCTEDGYSGDTYCVYCNKLLVKGDVEQKIKHKWGTNNKCSMCGTVKSDSKEVVKAKSVKAKITKATNKKGKKIELTLKKQKGYKYEIQVSTKKNFKKSVKTYTTSKTKYTIKKLSKNKKYYIRVRTYKVIDGKKVYGKWSSTKSIKVKK